jgi:hypothetical protein
MTYPFTDGQQHDLATPLMPAEERVLNLLGQAWDEFLTLPVLHPMHQAEFVSAIHEAQRLVLSRPAKRAQNARRTVVKE